MITDYTIPGTHVLFRSAEPGNEHDRNRAAGLKLDTAYRVKEIFDAPGHGKRLMLEECGHNLFPVEFFDDAPVVGVYMGSSSDWNIMMPAALRLQRLGIPYECKTPSAHRTAEDMAELARQAWPRGMRYMIAGAGGSAHLPGMMAAFSDVGVVVVGIPIWQKGSEAPCEAALDSIVFMPTGCPVGTMGTNKAENGALYVAEMISHHHEPLRQKLIAHKAKLAKKARESKLEIPEGAKLADEKDD